MNKEDRIEALREELAKARWYRKYSSETQRDFDDLSPHWQNLYFAEVNEDIEIIQKHCLLRAERESPQNPYPLYSPGLREGYRQAHQDILVPNEEGISFQPVYEVW